MSRAWYSDQRWPLVMKPLSKLAAVIIAYRRQRFLQQGAHWKSPVPLIIVGNITIGGTGKTPLVQALVSHLKAWGYHPGIISRGYGGKSDVYPLPVTPSLSADQCGDEPLMLAQTTGCPVYVDPDRCAAAQAMLKHEQVDIIISDDGLQHYRLDRDIEFVVIDGERGVGNGQLLPAGPLREPVTRLDTVDYVIVNGKSKLKDFLEFPSMSLIPIALVNLSSGKAIPVNEMAATFKGQTIQAIAGIGNPDRFFNTLRACKLEIQTKAFADHHAYSKADLDYNGPIIMTEKDAVKCYAHATTDHWYLKVEAQLPDALFSSLRERLRQISGVH